MHFLDASLRTILQQYTVLSPSECIGRGRTNNNRRKEGYKNLYVYTSFISYSSVYNIIILILFFDPGQRYRVESSETARQLRQLHYRQSTVYLVCTLTSHDTPVPRYNSRMYMLMYVQTVGQVKCDRTPSCTQQFVVQKKYDACVQHCIGVHAQPHHTKWILL